MEVDFLSIPYLMNGHMKMNKKYIIVCLLLIAVLFIPIPRGTYDDGGSKEYVAFTYKIIKWNRLTSDGIYKKTRIYFFKDKYKTIDELAEIEFDNIKKVG